MASLRSDIQIAPQDLFVNSTTQPGDLGARATTGDGRYFRLVQAGSTTAIIAGQLQQASVQNTGIQNLAVAAAAVGAFAITTTTTVTCSANQFAGGLISVRDTTAAGQGYQYRIKSHAAASAAVVTFNLEDAVQVALTTSSHIDVVPNIYSGAVQYSTTVSSIPLGVSVGSIPASSYGWLQTHGPATVLVDAGAPAVGTPIAPSVATAGAVGPCGGTNICIGAALVSTTSAKYQQVFLTID